MGGGLIQLVAIGEENLYLTDNPQITYFKLVYRRHTNFSKEQIPTYFIQKADFGEKVSCIVSPEGDLIDNMSLVVVLPKVKKLVDESNLNQVDSNGYKIYEYNRFAWVKNIGYAIIKSIEIEINGRLIDKHYGEWLYIWNELTGPRNIGHEKNIGNVRELYDYSNEKEEYKLQIPLSFWFCRNSGQSLPIVSLKYSQVKINVEFNLLEKCYSLLPTHYLECEDDIINLSKYEYIEQTISTSDKRFGLFVNYDIINKRLYYLKLSNEKFIGYPTTLLNLTNLQINNLLDSDLALVYKIIGKETNYNVTPKLNSISVSNTFDSLNYLSIKESYLLIDYIYLDEDERLKFGEIKHDYLIEQIYFTPNTKIQGNTRKIQLSIDHPCKLTTWLIQRDDIYNSNDLFNYTDSAERVRTEFSNGECTLGNTVGKNYIDFETILLNGLERISFRDSKYFNYIQPYQNFKYGLSEGINIYSYALFPDEIQPSGACNMGQIDIIELKLRISKLINEQTTSNVRSYSLVENILRISNGYCGLLFTK